MELSDTVACSLTTADHKTQRERWLALGENFQVDRIETTDGVELRFQYDQAVENELRELIAVESDCCSWAAWDVTRVEGTLVMAARSKGTGITTLHGMFTNVA